jgi:hypothetical protein
MIPDPVGPAIVTATVAGPQASPLAARARPGMERASGEVARPASQAHGGLLGR